MEKGLSLRRGGLFRPSTRGELRKTVLKRKEMTLEIMSARIFHWLKEEYPQLFSGGEDV